MKLAEKIKELMKKYEKYIEEIKYVFFGGLTTLVNFVVHIILSRIFNLDLSLSNAIAWFVSVIFAFFTNKIFVFESKSKNSFHMIKEFFSFFAGRMFSGVLDIVLFKVLTQTVGVYDLLAKVLNSVIVIVLNYFISKYFVFRKKDK